ncbi:hypothetical protein [Clostridium algidicarnis]|uniref:hypothetical protein n=1 Tax=Clostridium algidicarnis TaxID=37659 RepID=UPI001C0D9D56|nr:hypothetical protein [Clostridium algidicarnis]MBU3226808.1 hypothetical protein [Clostridium algidicarnis]MBU3250281.1 hypothetical protein [Clostridium algidicarnis]
MMLDKERFKILKQDGGGILGIKFSTMATHEYGLDSLKSGTIGNLFIMGNGVFFDVAFGNKYFFEINIIKDVNITNGKLCISTNEEDGEIIFRTKKEQDLNKIYNEVIKRMCTAEDVDNLKLESKSELKKAEKENRKIQFEKIMASNPEVTIHVETQSSKQVSHKKTFLEKKKEESQIKKENIIEMKKQGIAFCPKCKGTSLTYVEHHKKLSVGRAITGGILAGEVGAILGGLSSKKVKGMVKCLNCGYSWKK